MGIAHNIQFDWSDENVAILTKLYHRGYSGSMIAKALNEAKRSAMSPVSRNGVIGKLYRLGLTEAGTGFKRPSAPSARKPKMNVVTHKKATAPKSSGIGRGNATGSTLALLAPRMARSLNGKPEAPIIITGPHADSLNLMIAEPTFKATGCCKWPTGGEAEATVFCCRPVTGLYCDYHAEAAFKPRTAAQKRSESSLYAYLKRVA